MHTQTQLSMDWTSALEHEARQLVEALDTHPGAQRLFDGSIDTEGYAAWLAQTYHYVRWTTPLLEQAGRRMKRQGRHPRLAELLLQKCLEERGHERWLLADLKNLGWTREQVEDFQLCPAVAAYVAWNRFTAEVASPAETGAAGLAGAVAAVQAPAPEPARASPLSSGPASNSACAVSPKPCSSGRAGERAKS